jgi:hypothetical protein
MPVSNSAIAQRQWLARMYRDDYFPPHLVDKIKNILLGVCERIEAEVPQSEPELLIITHAAVEEINTLQEEFEEHDSDLETEARESMGEDFLFIVRSYGFEKVDIEDVIAPRDW